MTPTPTITFGFWPFASGGMLLWGLAALLPLVIHLWNRRQYHELPWAAMEYLLAAARKNARRIRLEQWLLLLLRSLILLLLALALADPILPLLGSLVAPAGTRPQSHHILVLDGSYSMQYQVGDQTRFEAAQQSAVDLVRASAQGDGFSLFLLADPPVSVVGDVAFDPADVADEIHNLVPPDGGANLSATLAEVERALQQAVRQHPRLTQHHIHFFTDLGRVAWDEVNSADNRARLARLAEHASLQVHPIGTGETDNLAVTRLSLRDPLVAAGVAVTLDAELQNFGSQDYQQHPVELLVDDRPVQLEYVDLRAQQQASISFTYRFEVPGEHQVQVRLGSDPLTVDNQRWLSVPVRETLRVLCIQGKADSARYVALALQPDEQSPLVQTEVASESAILETDLEQYQCVFLCNVGRFGRDEAAVLFQYLKNGGGLVFLLGDQVQAESYNAELAGQQSGRRILPAGLGATVAAGQFQFEPGDYEHPIVAPFRGHQSSGLHSTPVRRYIPLRVNEQTSARVALRFDNGDPAIVEEAVQRGRVIVVATAASPASVDTTTTPNTTWSDLATWPSFVPLVQEILALAVRDRLDDRQALVGEPLQGEIASTASGLTLHVVGPDDAEGEGDRVPLLVDGEDSRWAFDAARHSGIYRARYGAPVTAEQLFAVNVNTRESRLEMLDGELLPSQFGGSAETGDETSNTLMPAASPHLFRYLLGGLLCLLFGETFLAWYFGSENL